MDKVFREWNDGPVFCAEKRITFGQCDMYGRIKFADLLMLISDAAGEDYRRRGLTYEYMSKDGVVFLVSRISIHILNKIKGESCFTVKTWEHSLKGVKFNRNVEIIAEDGTPLVHIKSVWIPVNINTRKIIRPTAYPYKDRINLCDRDVNCLECGKIKRPDVEHYLGERKIMFSDMDANGHVNNTRYGAFAEDCAAELFANQTSKIETIRINFVNEVTLGDTLVLKGGYEEDEKKVVVVGEKEDTVSFECEFYLA